MVHITKSFASCIFAVGICLSLSLSNCSAQTSTDITSHANELNGTSFTAHVYEQCDITVPSSVAFNVGDISDPTPAVTAVSLTVTNIVTSSASRVVRVSVKAASSQFTPSVSGASTWSAGAVTWDAGTSWSGATGQSGTLSQSSYKPVAIGQADAAAFSTSTLHFTLAANTNVKRSGNYVLALTWKVECMDGGEGGGG